MSSPKMGRPKAAPEEKRSEIVVTRWTPGEAARLDEIAAELAPGAPEALSRADVLRALFMAHNRRGTTPEPPPPPKPTKKGRRP